MGLDLSLLPVEADFEQNDGSRWGYSHSILDMDRDRNLFYKFQQLETTPAPDNFTIFVSQEGGYEEPHYDQTTTDAYGSPVGCVSADVLTRHGGRARESDRNRAVFAYLRALPPETMVALYWH